MSYYYDTIDANHTNILFNKGNCARLNNTLMVIIILRANNDEIKAVKEYVHQVTLISKSSIE